MTTSYLSPAQIAKVLGVHPETVGTWIRTGYLPAVNLSPSKRRACWRISEDELAKWVANRSAA
ncbi:helix-turn-helix domain-containing protein [Leekyejoonella antrihumi]|uniref:Helix-turn-helix domain-containing protein n=1 Tax=Leekyejoonella antrihumi TaxID=1660198 RepID=A0A563DUB7_9MICO|nr:helix-turn-helix domain-containing protein [Leekyejoonella antrihumi]TWP33848.1 helix-turn-helix domain-containing protein [Leekyejoonella antrihumi]